MAHMTGGEIVAEYLIREGVPYVLGIPGHGCLGLVGAFHHSDGLTAGWWDVSVPTYLAERRARYERERAEER